jgi:protein gp37
VTVQRQHFALLNGHTLASFVENTVIVMSAFVGRHSYSIVDTRYVMAAVVISWALAKNLFVVVSVYESHRISLGTLLPTDPAPVRIVMSSLHAMSAGIAVNEWTVEALVNTDATNRRLYHQISLDSHQRAK